MQRPMGVWVIKTTDEIQAERQTQTDQWTQGYINRQKDGTIRLVN